MSADPSSENPREWELRQNSSDSARRTWRPTVASGVGVCCGHCGGDVHMVSCPTHHWTVSSVCLGCGFTNVVDATCKECDWPKVAGHGCAV